MSQQSFFPALSKLVPSERLPGFVQPVFSSISDKVFYKSYQVEKSINGDTAYHNIVLVFNTEIGLNLFGGEDGFELLLNPGTTANTTELPLSLYYNLPILKYVNGVSVQQLSTPADYLNLILEITGINEAEILEQAVRALNEGSFQQFIDDFNANPDYSAFPQLTGSVSGNDDEVAISIASELKTNGVSVIQYVMEELIAVENDIPGSFENLYTVFKELLGSFSFEDLLALVIPTFSVGIESIRLALAFPRTWLKPVDANGDVIEDEAVKSLLSYDVGSLLYHSEKGLEFNNPDTFDLTPSQIGNTGLLIDFDGLKFDLRNDQNIQEAIDDDRPEDFKGIFVQSAEITLPKKWFKDGDSSAGTTASIVGSDLLIGTGGVSGNIALQATNPADPSPKLIKQIGDNGFEVSFSKFDMTFKQNSVVASNLIGGMKIPRLKDANGNDAEIEIVGHLDDAGDFSLTASEKDGFAPLSIPEVMDITIQSIELGREGDDFFIGTACKIKFTSAVMDKLLGGKEIEIPQLRIYSHGSFEIVGGTIPVPSNFTLNLGPVEIGISGVNFGSYQQEYEGEMRKYNFFGFDGALGLGPLGFEARGKGMQYYYTVDNDPANGKPKHSYFRIQTIEVDITIPGSATPDSATAIINGYLSIPQPGESPEYSGGVSLKLPKAKIAGSAEMRLAPKAPAFIVDASIELPKPIPLASTGLGIYGFRGLLGYRYVAEKEAVGLTSGEDTWYDYYTYPPRGVDISKFSGPEQTKDYNNPISVGAGATLATAFDDGVVVSTRLFLLLSLPSVFLLEGKASILSKRLGLDDSREPPFFAFIAYGDNSIELGMGADFSLPQSNGWIIDLYANVEAGFFFKKPSAWYVNFGTKEQPISAKLLTLFTAQSYLMLSARGIEAGARAEFNFNKKFGPARVKAYLYIEVGGKFSFERPQIGAYLAAGGGLEVKFWVITVGISFDAIFSVEAPKPFLIFAEVRVCGKIKIGFIKIKKCITVRIKWEKSKQVDRTPIAPLLPERKNELVKGVNMLTGETFELLNLDSSFASGSYNPDSDSKLDRVVLPLDTYVDIKFTKSLLPNAVSDKIGGVNEAPKNYSDIIPPEKRVKGKEVRQVKHRYSIENIELKAWTGSAWVDYHPYEAITEEDNTNIDFSGLKFGQWQKSGDGYNAVRLLADSPFSYTEQGEPGWFIPEEVGVTPLSLFCEGKKRQTGCADWVQKTFNRRYYGTRPFSSKKAYFRLLADEEEFAYVSGAYNTFGFTRSLAFNNHNQMEILLPEPSVGTSLKLSTKTNGLIVKYFRSLKNDSSLSVQHQLVQEIFVPSSTLNQEITYNNVNIPISKIIIQPDCNDNGEVAKIERQIEQLFNDTYAVRNPEEGQEFNAEYPDDIETYFALMVQLEDMKQGGYQCVCKPTTSILLTRPQVYAQVYNEDDNDGIDEYRFRVYDDQADLLISSSTKYYSKEAAINEMNLAVDAIRNSNECIHIKRTKTGKWYFNIVDSTGETIARKIQYFATESELNREIEELKKAVRNSEVVITEDEVVASNLAVIDNTEVDCHTFLHEVCWESVEDYVFNLNIPGQDAIQQDYQDTVDAVSKRVSPIWRPDTKYYVHFQLKDEVDDGENQGIYDYYYGFRTAGPIGHFHNATGVDYGEERDADGKLAFPDRYDLTSIRKYIDYQRSYPNADGNLLKSKPLFYSSEDGNNEIRLFFSKPYTYHMLSDWPAYNGLPALEGEMKIVVKDPIEDVTIQNPPPPDVITDEIPQTVESWTEDNEALMPEHLRFWNNFVEAQASNPDVSCLITGGELIRPKSYIRTIRLNHLKPNKLYTAIVNNTFEGITTEIHNFVFRTSRYKDFTEQVNSYLLLDEGGNSKEAIFTVSEPLTAQEITTSYNIVAGTSDSNSDNLAGQYPDLFDRVIEGVLGIKPVDPAMSTEFNLITDENSGNVIALLIRNPEPFNDPKMPLSEVSGTISVLNGNGNPDSAYKVLFSNDYSQALIMHQSKEITTTGLDLRFQYKKWNGDAYVIADTITIENISII